MGNSITTLLLAWVYLYRLDKVNKIILNRITQVEFREVEDILAYDFY